MKKMMFMVIAAVTMGAVAQSLSLSDARAKIGDMIANPSVLTSTIKQLSAADQKLLLADVNEAVAKMPDSAEAKSAKFLDVNRAALKGAKKGTVADLLAEVFATASLEALTVINEVFAADLFNRDANPDVKYTDEQFVKIAKSAMEKIAARNSNVDNGAVRTGFAALMFIRASNGSPADLADTLAAYLPEDTREIAKREWFPSALAKGDEKSYDPMLGTTDAGTLPNEMVVLRLAAAHEHDALLFDFAVAGFGKAETYSGTIWGAAGQDLGLGRVPFSGAKPRPQPQPQPHPQPYDYQTNMSQGNRTHSGMFQPNVFPSNKSCCCPCPCSCGNR